MAYLRQTTMQEWISYFIGSEPYRYHCWHRSSEQWFQQGKVHHTYGMINLFGGVFFLITTTLVLWAFLSHNIMKSSCYKILFVSVIISWFEVMTLSIWPAFLLLQGGVFCSYPFIGMVVGRSLTMEWISGTSLCIYLAINRLADMTKNYFLLELFDKPNKVIFVMLLVVLYSLIIACFTDPCLYDSLRRGYSINPNNGMTPSLFSSHSIHIYNSIFLILFFFILTIIIYKLCTEHENCWRGSSELQRKIIMQSLFICLQYVIPCVFNLFITIWNTLESPQCFIEGTHFLFQFFACFNGIICLFFNRPIRVRFLEKTGLRKYVVQPNRRGAQSISKSIV